MPKISLKKFLQNRQMELQQTVIALQEKMLNSDFTETDRLNLDCVNSQLNLITEIVNICNNRSRY